MHNPSLKCHSDLHMVTPCAQGWVIQTTRHRVVERIQRRGIMDSFDRDRFDFLIGIDAKVDPRDGRGHRTSEIRHGSCDASCYLCFPSSFSSGGRNLAAEGRPNSDDLEKLTRTFFLPCATALSALPPRDPDSSVTTPPSRSVWILDYTRFESNDTWSLFQCGLWVSEAFTRAELCRMYLATC